MADPALKHSVARSDQESIAQSLPWEGILTLEALKGPRHFQRWFLGASSAAAPSGPQAYKPKTQGKPWAKLSWPVGPKTQCHPNSSLRQTSKLQTRINPGLSFLAPSGQRPAQLLTLPGGLASIFVTLSFWRPFGPYDWR
jgi:hypothetical protein